MAKVVIQSQVPHSLGTDPVSNVRFDSGAIVTFSGGSVSDGDKGDITISSSGAVYTIDAGAVSLSKTSAGVQASLALADSAQQPPAEGAFVDGDKTKLDGIETSATADQTGAEIKALYEAELNTNAFTDAEQTKLAGIETGADVTNTANVTSSGALMDSEVTNLAQVKAFNSADYATAAQGAKADTALQSTSIDTLAELNAIVADATLIDTSDSRLSDARTPTAHASTHTNGTDDIQDATAAQKGLATATQISKLDGIEAGATADQTGAEIKSLYEAEANTNAYTDAEQTKVGYLTVTQAVDLDQMETDIAALANGMVYKGNWDASVGTFPGGGGAEIGWFYTVSVGGTVDSVVFAVDDRLVGIVDNASTTTYVGNWTKLDATDAVQSVAGKTGAVTLVEADITDLGSYITATSVDTLTNKTLTTPTITLKQSTAPTPTTEGDIQWDTDDNKIKIGDGAGTKTFSDDSYNASTYAATSHTHTASEITDFDTEVANNSAVAANTAKVTNATHTGDVTGSTTLTIADEAVTYAKMQHVSATDKILGRSTPGAGDVEEITCTAFARTLLDDATQGAAQTTLGVDPAGTDNSTDVTLAGTPDYITISGQIITRNQIDLTADVTGVLPVGNIDTDVKTAAITAVFDGGGAAITAASQTWVQVPYACTIQAVTMLADVTGSAVVDIWKDTYANYPPLDSDSITASAVPTISSSTKSTDSTLTGWTTTIAADDILVFNVDSVSTITKLTLILDVIKT